MEEILASIRRIISDEVASEPSSSPRADTPARSSRDGASRDPAPGAAPRAASPTPLRPAANAQSSGALAYAPAPFRERSEAPVDYAPRGRAPAADPFVARPLSLSTSSPVYSGGSAARALEAPAPARPVIETRAPEPRRAEPRLFPDSRPLPEPRPLPDLRALPEARARLEPRPAAEARPAAAPFTATPSMVRPLAARPALANSAATNAAMPRPQAPKPSAPLDSDLDKPLAAALLDLAAVEQAVQAELANVTISVSPPVAEAPSREAAPAAVTPVAPPAPAAPTEAPATGPGVVDAVKVEATLPVLADTDPVRTEEPQAAAAPVEVSPVAEAGELPRQTLAAQPAAGAIHPAAPIAGQGAARASHGFSASTDEASLAVPQTAAVRVRPDFPAADARMPEPRFAEPRVAETRSSEARMGEPRPAEARLAETRLSESRLVVGSRLAAGTESAEPERERLVSPPASSAVSAAFGSLHRTMSASPRTIDDLVTDALRPMLKAWLDENLPAMVERLVRAEIERVARQGQ
ncbi:DUF2497 domain-containing protein [Ancylobacter sp.]|uniref:DUF2497 domain-containing protein n=1 Tax=Ancylobacter sp. TaxID=1872567 RepID=UPI003D12406D